MMSNKIEALSKGVHTTESANGRGYIKIGFGSLAELHAADDELRALLAEASAQQPNQPVAESLAQMITEWVDTGIKMGTDWRPGLASVIALRLARYPAVERQEPVALPERSFVGDIRNPYRHTVLHDGYISGWNAYQDAMVKIGPLYTSPPAPVAVVLDERAEFENWIVGEWPLAPLRYVRDALPEGDPLHGTYCDEYLQRAWVGWQARASLNKAKELNQ